ncbi:hypothetical protein [Undibacterium sp. TS12]|uniref:HD domain-containing protein n=1 Tax=Undibacterium sp. TS12 TaxID=2908202 RepID=UPI001F4CA970|nr:hypothetical protein [Undibacterium sp. TS12]MCH8618865.1 hypothetical protein [Undibacterium sp. TS12]
MFLIPSEQKNKLQQQWSDLVQELAGSQKQSKEVWALFDRYYSEPQRSFHNLSHIQALLRHADEVRSHIHHFPVVALSIWLHDLVHDTRGNDNERKSAELASILLSRLEIDSSIILHVQQCILATARHEVPKRGIVAADLPLFLDLDMAIYGSAPDVYQQYSRAIRNEFRWLEAPLYRAGRIKVLKRFAEREELFFHPAMAAQYDAQARANLAWEIKKLTFF